MGKTSKKHEYSSDSEASSDSVEVIKSKKHKKSSKKSKKHKSKKKKRDNSSSSSESDAWVEKNIDNKSPSPAPKDEGEKKQRDDWMSADNFFIPTFTKEKQQTKSAADKGAHEAYDPATSSRELNPYYKTGEGGMPSFQRPKEHDDDNYGSYTRNSAAHSSSSGNWRKSRPEDNRRETQVNSRMDSHRRSQSRSYSSSRSRSPTPEEKPRVMLPAKPTPEDTGTVASHSDFLTDEQMNEIGAKMIKAELMGNETLAAKLKGKLDRAKAFKTSGKAPPVKLREKEQVVLSITNAAGVSRPAAKRGDTSRRPQDKKKRTKRVETHEDGERTKYYPDDGKYDIKQMVSSSPALVFNFLIKIFVYFSLNEKSTSTARIRTLNLQKRSVKSKTTNKWTWQTFSQTQSEKTSPRRQMNAMMQFESINEWRKFLTHATSVSIHRRWTRIW